MNLLYSSKNVTNSSMAEEYYCIVSNIQEGFDVHQEYLDSIWKDFEQNKEKLESDNGIYPDSFCEGLVHSDRGVHYRWPGWIKIMDDFGLTRSMSKKGCSPDNSACEGVFGRIKNEMFYNTDWTGVSISKFITILDKYLYWYNEVRIKNH